MRCMSESPTVTLPRGVQRTDFVGGHARLAGVIAPPEGESRGTILLVPGFTGSKEDFRILLPYLAQLGYCAASYDHRGQFESPGPDALDGYAMTEFAADLLAVAHQLRERSTGPLHLVGHSFGGLVSRAAMIDALTGRDSTRARIPFASLTLLASGRAALPEDLQVLAGQFVALLPATPLDVIWEHKDALDRQDDPNPPDDALLEFLRHRFVSNNPYSLAAQAQILMEIEDSVDVLARATAEADLPVLVAFGENDDRWTPAEQEGMADSLAARRLRWPGAAHSPNVEQPEMCAAGLEAFFADVAQTTARSIGFPTGHPGYTPGMELRAPVDHTPAGVSAARRSVVRQLQAWGLDSAVDDMSIVVSELVTNAVRYGKNPVELRLRVTGDCLRVEVSDGNPTDVPMPREATNTESNGRGMPLIDALTFNWGVDVSDAHKVVWAEVSLN